MEIKHTKGEWVITYKTPSIIQIKAHIGFICELPEVRTEADLFEAQANAKLIAAAPELLEACVKAIKDLERPHSDGSIAIDLLQKAIKKVTE